MKLDSPMQMPSEDKTDTLSETGTSSGIKAAMLFVVVMASQAAQGTEFGGISPVMAQMADALGAHGASIAQLVFALPALGLLVAGVFSGWILEQGGLKRVLVISMIIYGFAGAVPTVSNSVPLILLSRLILGMSCAVLTTCCTLLLVLTYTGPRRAWAMGQQGVVGNFAGIFGVMLAGIIAHVFGWRAAFLIFPGAGWLVALFAAIAVHPKAGTAAAPERPADDNGKGGVLEVTKLLWPVFLAGGLLFILPMVMGGTVPFLVEQDGLHPGIEQSVLLSVFPGFGGLVSFGFGALRARIGAGATFGLALFSSALGLLILGLFASIPLAFVGAAFVGIGWGLYFPHLILATTGFAPPHLRGHAVGVFTSALYLGAFASPGLLFLLERGFGIAGTFTALGIVCFAGLGLVFLAKTPLLLTAPATEAAHH